jgi:hypothetical protein
MFGFLEKRRRKTQVGEEALLSVSHFKHSVCVMALSQWLQRGQETDEELSQLDNIIEFLLQH